MIDVTKVEVQTRRVGVRERERERQRERDWTKREKAETGTLVWPLHVNMKGILLRGPLQIETVKEKGGERPRGRRRERERESPRKEEE